MPPPSRTEPPRYEVRYRPPSGGRWQTIAVAETYREAVRLMVDTRGAGEFWIVDTRPEED